MVRRRGWWRPVAKRFERRPWQPCVMTFADSSLVPEIRRVFLWCFKELASGPNTASKRYAFWCSLYQMLIWSCVLPRWRPRIRVAVHPTNRQRGIGQEWGWWGDRGRGHFLSSSRSSCFFQELNNFRMCTLPIWGGNVPRKWLHEIPVAYLTLLFYIFIFF